jgi:hypothetical protein
MLMALVVDTMYLKSIDKARRDIQALIAENNCVPILLRLTDIMPTLMMQAPYKILEFFLNSFKIFRVIARNIDAVECFHPEQEE